MSRKKNTKETEILTEGIQEAPVNETEDTAQEASITEDVKEISPELDSEEITQEAQTEASSELDQEVTEEKSDDVESIESPNIKVQIKPDERSIIGNVWNPEGFKPSEMGWWTTENDTKRRYNSGIFTNTQSGKFGTIRVCENGMFEFVKHQDWEKRKERTEDHVDVFRVINVSENHGLMGQQWIEIEVL